jgi:exonuclease VII large subunit
MESAVRQVRTRAELLLAELETLDNKVHANLRERFTDSKTDPAQLLQRLARLADRVPELEEMHEKIQARENALMADLRGVMRDNRSSVESLVSRCNHDEPADKRVMSEQLVNVA